MLAFRLPHTDHTCLATLFSPSHLLAPDPYPCFHPQTLSQWAVCQSCRSSTLPVTFCGSPGWGSLEPQPTDWPGAGARVWFPDPALVLPGWNCPLWSATPNSDRFLMLAWPGGPTRQQILPGNTDSAEIRGLEGGVSYSVRVTALIGDREGAPVSIVVTTRRRSSGWGEPWIGGLDGSGAGCVLEVE